MVVIGTIALVAMVFMLLISPENRQVEDLGQKIKKSRQQLDEMKETIKKSSEMAAAFAAVSNRLTLAEADVASGDIYQWTYDTIRRFKSAYRLEIPSMGQPSAGDADLLPGMSYRQVKLTLNGTGYYHDLGKFVADFENTFPHMRLVNLGLDPSAIPTAPERLAFHFDVIALVKPNN